MTGINLEAKFLGSMVGSALGDAIGELAFSHPRKDRLNPVLERISELRYTDDTAMAIGLAESLIRRQGLDQEDLGKTFQDNFNRESWRGYASGPPTIFSLVTQRGIPYREAAQSLFRGKGSLGNGAAMRIAPLGLFYHGAKDLYDRACASARVTHAHPVGMDGAAVQAFAVSQAAAGDPRNDFPKDALLQSLIRFARTPEIQEKMKLVEQLISREESPENAALSLGRSVAVHESMPFAVYSFFRYPTSFEECLFCAILHGGDRDTLGAMAGAVSGAYLGLDAIPRSWIQKLENKDYIRHLACSLARISGE